MKLTGGEALVKQLELEGASQIFGVPGVQLDWAVDALRRTDKIKFRTTRNEQSTSYMADGFSRVTGKPGVCMVVPGPGVLNAMAGLATAYACGSKVLCVAGQIDSRGVDKGFGLLHEIKNSHAVFDAATKWHAMARSPTEVPALIRRAHAEMHAGRPAGCPGGDGGGRSDRAGRRFRWSNEARGGRHPRRRGSASARRVPGDLRRRRRARRARVESVGSPRRASWRARDHERTGPRRDLRPTSTRVHHA